MMRKLKVPPKVKIYMWRVCRGLLSCKVKLFQKGTVEDKICEVCSTDIEDLWHLLIVSPFAEDCWRAAGIYDILNNAITQIESLKEVISA